MKTKTEFTKETQTPWKRLGLLLTWLLSMAMTALPVLSHAAAGDVDLSFDTGPDFDMWPYSIAVQNDGKILVTTAFTFASSPSLYMVRLNADGSLDDTFNVDIQPYDPIESFWLQFLIVQDDGKMLISGNVTSINGVGGIGVTRLNADGSLDPSFHMTDQHYHQAAIQSDGKIVALGPYWEQPECVRLDPNGYPDDTFVPPRLSGSLHACALQCDGKILIGGSMAKGLVRLNPNGTPDTSFLSGQSGVGGKVYSIVVQADDRIVVGGEFDQVNGVPSDRIARLNPDGSLDGSFTNGVYPGAYEVRSLALQADGKALAHLYTWHPSYRTNIVRLNFDGSLDPTFVVPWVAGTISSMTLQSDGDIIVGGSFNVVNEIDRRRVARLVGDCTPPVVGVPLQSCTGEAGGTLGLTIDVSGSRPIASFWYSNGTNLLGWDANDFLLLTNVGYGDAGVLTVVLSNVLGTVTSTPALFQVIPPVERRLVPGVNVWGSPGSIQSLESTEALGPAAHWQPRDAVSLTSPSQFWFDLSEPLPPQRFYRARQTGLPAVAPVLGIHLIPALTLTGEIGNTIRVDGINQIGPVDDWFTLDTVTLTNTSQLYFDVSIIDQPPRLYRLVPVP